MTDRQDKMQRGYFVTHKYGRKRRGCYGVCQRCGVKRRHTSSGWEWKRPDGTWTANNPVCAKRLQ